MTNEKKIGAVARRFAKDSIAKMRQFAKAQGYPEEEFVKKVVDAFTWGTSDDPKAIRFREALK